MKKWTPQSGTAVILASIMALPLFEDLKLVPI